MPLPLVVALSLMAMARAQYQVVSPYAAEGYITLRGSGTNETANGLAKASCVLEDSFPPCTLLDSSTRQSRSH